MSKYSGSTFIFICLYTLSQNCLNAREVITFISLDNERTVIRGELFKPKNVNKPPAIVMMHGCSGLYTRSGNLRTNSASWINRFLEWGYIVLAVDGFTPRGFRTMCKKKNRPLHSIDDRPFDAYGGLAWLSRQPFVNKNQVFLIGWSNGAMAALASLREDRVAYFGEGYRFKAAAAFYPGCITLKRRVRDRYEPYAPVLVFLGLADNWTWPKPCIKMIESAAKAGFPAKYIGYKGAHHAFDHPNLPIKTRISRNAKWKKDKKRYVTVGSNGRARESAVKTLKEWLRQQSSK